MSFASIVAENCIVTALLEYVTFACLVASVWCSLYRWKHSENERFDPRTHRSLCSCAFDSCFSVRSILRSRSIYSVLTKNLIVSKFATDTRRIPPCASAHNAVLSGELLQIQSATPQVEGPEHMDPLSNVIALTNILSHFCLQLVWLVVFDATIAAALSKSIPNINKWVPLPRAETQENIGGIQAIAEQKISLVLDMKQRFLKGRE